MNLQLIILALAIGQVAAQQCMCECPCTTTSISTTSTTTTKPTTKPVSSTTITTTTTPGPLDCGDYTISPGETYPIESPNYPEKYGETDSCKWEFTCDESSGVIGISCDDFKTEEDTECKKADFLKLTDSTGIIDFFCGKDGPDLQSADNYLEVKFNTDEDSTTKRGFSCSVTCMLKTTTSTIPPTKTLSSTTLTSTTTPPASTDSTTPYTTTPETTTPYTTTPKTSTPGSTTISTTRTLSITTTTTPGPLACGEYTISPGEMHPIQSPNYPDKYGDSDSCNWEFTCDNSDGVIGISCDDFKTEEDTECKKADFLKLTDSTGIIDFFCGKDGPDLQSTDNYLEVKFNTDDDSTTKRGFSCSIICTVMTSSNPTTATATPTTITPSSTAVTTTNPTTASTTPTTITPSLTSTTTVKPTTTVDPDKTTTEEPTTTPDGGWSGNCSKVITASAGMEEYWVSPRYDGTTHYPQGDYCCSLNITIPDTYSMFMVNMDMQSPSEIYASGGCAYDNIKYTSSAGSTSTLCGELSGQTWSEIMAFDGSKLFYFTWCSSRADGETDIGFKMKITGLDLWPSGRK